jgi:phospholipid transport system transporter-binding protein
MVKLAEIQLRNTTLFISGDLDFTNVMSVYEKSLALTFQCPELIFDFSSLKSTNSAGLTLLIEWIKLSKKQNKSIRFMHLPQEIMSIAKAADIDEMLLN